MEINSNMNECKEGNLNRNSTDILHRPILACVCDIVSLRSEHYLNKYMIRGVQNHQGFKKDQAVQIPPLGQLLRKNIQTEGTTSHTGALPGTRLPMEPMFNIKFIK